MGQMVSLHLMEIYILRVLALAGGFVSSIDRILRACGRLAFGWAGTCILLHEF